MDIFVGFLLNRETTVKKHCEPNINHDIVLFHKYDVKKLQLRFILKYDTKRLLLLVSSFNSDVYYQLLSSDSIYSHFMLNLFKSKL